VNDGRVLATCHITRVFRATRNGVVDRGVLSDSDPKGKPVSSRIESEVTALVATTLGVDETMVRRDTTFAGNLGADSLDCVALILAIEDEFRIDIHDEDAAEILTVGQMIEYVRCALSDQEPTVTRRSSSEGTVGLR
jgi:acyl carrier protein